MQRVLTAVDSRILDFLNHIILELQYNAIQVDIFKDAKDFVDEELTKISPTTLGKLITSYEKLSKISTPLECAQAAYACREILQDFTDAIFKPKFLVAGELVPTHEQTKNKVYYTLRQCLKDKKGRESELFSSQLDYRLAYFDKFITYIQKEAHPVGFDPTLDDAKRCIIYTYLVLWDIIRFMR